ncbi:hypothetical protein M8C21_019580, partial [Ambrosia artemisiifolia]
IWKGFEILAAKSTPIFPDLINQPLDKLTKLLAKLLKELDIPNLPYLQAMVKETIRLHPSAPMMQRSSRKDCIVGGYLIPAKTTIFVNVWSLGRDPTYWESPLEFQPERFEEKQVDVRGQHFNLLPFGSGKRMCPGISLGLMCFTWKAGKYGNLNSVDMEEGVGLTLPIANPLVCVPVAQLNPLPLSHIITLKILLIMNGDFQSNTIVIIICISSAMIIWKLYKSWGGLDIHLPPTPFRLPIIGHLHLLAPSVHRAFHKLSIRYGPMFRIYLGSTPCVVISSPDMAKEIFKVHENAFLNRPYNSTINYMSYGGQGFIFGPYGSYWKFMKKITMSYLLNGKTLDLLLPIRRDEINHFIKKLSQNAKLGKSVELEVELGKLTSKLILRMVTGKRCSEDEDEIGDIMEIMADVDKLFGKFNLSDHIWFCKNLDLQGLRKKSMNIRIRFDVLMERILKECEETRKQKMETGEVKDLLNILLDILEDESMEIKLTRENIKAFIL